MEIKTASHDIVVVGGGLAGTVAAIAAARMGSDVALITNRPVLGGNSSSEIRVWVCGATAHGAQRYARENGIMGELFLENQYRNPQGNPIYWDQVLLDFVRAEPNVTLHLNTDVRDVEMAQDGTAIESVTGWTMGSEISTTFTADMFLDCTGDGLVGALAGADHRIGRESRDEYGESWAPEAADDELLGSSIFFSTHDTGRPERFVPPSIAQDISSTPILKNRVIRTGDNGCNYWWIEWGGHMDTVTGNEAIRDELWSVVFGVWDHIKNSGEFPDADTLTMDWVGALPGKREYRRFLGDHVLTQQDILQQRDFDDTVAFGGWSIDLHPVEGVYAETAGAHQRYANGTYDIPFRSLYSRNITNMLMAGRNISASHIAFGSTRVMATCATQGQAIGTAAHLAHRESLTPRQLGTTHISLLQQTLLNEDAPLIGVRAEDPTDKARTATITASSQLTKLATPAVGALAAGTDGEEHFPLDRDVAILLPVDPALGQIALRTRSGQETTLTAELWTTGKGQNYVPVDHRLTVTGTVPAGDGETLLDFDWTPDAPANAVIVIRRQPGVELVLVDNPPYGVQALRAKLDTDAAFDDHIPDAEDQPILEWEARTLRGRCFAFTASAVSDAWSAGKVVDGYQRPFNGPHMWCSEPGVLEDGPVDLTLTWQQPTEISEVRLILNDDVDADVINLHHHTTDWEAVPTLVRDYDVQARVNGTWQAVEEVRGNRQRHRIHSFEAVEAEALRIHIIATNGLDTASVCAVKVH